MGVYEDLPSDNKRYGYRIYNITPNSPLHLAGVSSLSDFIIPPDEIYTQKKCFVDWISEHAGEELYLQLYSLKTRVFTELKIKTASQPKKEGLLGGFIRFENWSTAHTGVLHVIGVKKSSFADKKLNLDVGDDYIVAIHPLSGVLISLNDQHGNPMSILANAIKENIGKECKFYIYNSKRGEGRVEQARIDDDQNFQLGCDVAYGKLHEFPYLIGRKIMEEKEERKDDVVNLKDSPMIMESEVRKLEGSGDVKKNENEEKLDAEDNNGNNMIRIDSGEIKNEEISTKDQQQIHDSNNNEKGDEGKELPMLKDML